MSVSLADNIFYQSAGWHPLAAPAQTLKPVAADMSLLLAKAAAAASAQPGSTLLVSLTRPLEPDSGMPCHHPALLTAVAARVSDFEVKDINVLFVEFNLKDFLPQVLSPLQTTPEVILTTLRGRIGYK